MGHSAATSFCLVGQFLGYELKGHKIHAIHFSHSQQDYRLKLSSSARDDLLRAALEGNLQVGDWVEVSGLQDGDRPKRPQKSPKFKAHALRRVDPQQAEHQVFPQPGLLSRQSEPCQPNTTPAQPRKRRTKVLICQKSSCCKRGGKAVLKQLQKHVRDRQLEDQITLRCTGCMGSCSKGPLLVIDKDRYKGVSPKDVSSLLGKYLGS